MKASSLGMLAALLFVGMCTTMQLNQEGHQLKGYTPAGDRVIQYQYDENNS